MYNLGAQSHVRTSFATSEFTADVDGLGSLTPFGLLGEAHQGLSGLDVRLGPRGAAERNDALPPAFALRRRQVVRLLNRGQLPRGLWHTRVQWHLLQPRAATAWHHLCHVQGAARRCSHPFGIQQTLVLGTFGAARDWDDARAYVHVKAMWMM